MRSFLNRSVFLTLLFPLAATLSSCGPNESDPSDDADKALCLSLGEDCWDNLAICNVEWCEEIPNACDGLSPLELCQSEECQNKCNCEALTDAECINAPYCIEKGYCEDPCKTFTSCKLGDDPVCNGRKNGKIMQCGTNETGCPLLKQIQACSGSTPYCIEAECHAQDLDACLPQSNDEAQIIKVTDGDTIRIRIAKEGCLSADYSVRLHGIDCPECEKAQGSDHYYTCIKSTNYGHHRNASGDWVTNDPYGYEAWQKATELLPEGSTVKITCDRTESDGGCEIDDTDKRRLVYISYQQNGTWYDFSTEITRAGYALANTDYYCTTSKMSGICTALGEAQNAKRGMWANKSITSVLNGIYGKKWKSKMQSRCGLSGGSPMSCK